MGKHGALGAAGRPGCVKDRSQIVRSPFGIAERTAFRLGAFHQASIPLVIQRLYQRSMRPGDLRHALPCPWIAHDEPRLRIAHEVIDFSQGISRVERKVDGSRAHASEIEHQCLWALLHLNGHPVSRAHAELVEGGRDTA